MASFGLGRLAEKQAHPSLLSSLFHPGVPPRCRPPASSRRIATSGTRALGRRRPWRSLRRRTTSWPAAAGSSFRRRQSSSRLAAPRPTRRLSSGVHDHYKMISDSTPVTARNSSCSQLLFLVAFFSVVASAESTSLSSTASPGEDTAARPGQRNWLRRSGPTASTPLSQTRRPAALDQGAASSPRSPPSRASPLPDSAHSS